MFAKTIAVGRLTRDPETKEFGEKSVCRFTVAVDDGFGENKTTDFYPCAAWNQQGKNVQNFTKKGSLVLVEGRFKSSKKEDRTYWELRSDTVKFLSSNNAQVSGTQEQQVQQFNQQYQQQQQMQQQFQQPQFQQPQGQVQFEQQPQFAQQTAQYQHNPNVQQPGTGFGTGMDFNVSDDSLPF